MGRVRRCDHGVMRDVQPGQRNEAGIAAVKAELAAALGKVPDGSSFREQHAHTTT